MKVKGCGQRDVAPDSSQSRVNSNLLHYIGMRKRVEGFLKCNSVEPCVVPWYAPVSERRNYQATRVTEVLVTVQEVRVRLTHDAIIALLQRQIQHCYISNETRKFNHKKL